MHEDDGQSGCLDHAAKRFRRRTAIVFQKHDDAAGFEESSDAREETPVQLPILIMEAQFTRRNVDEMWRVADDQIPLLGCRDIVEVIGMIDRDAIRQSVLRNSAAARRDGFRVHVG